ncbi:MAG TPA: sigma-70 family RNA polymerase sigma factor [Thermoleophilaceae bacterium]|nr:sigma-70 family RNA polymerase sigma factor [Thermoleophilaceae bacterium]
MRRLARLSGGADESALARRAAAGDRDAFARLYERHESRVFNLCYRILGSRDDAADAAQEAFVGILRRLPELAGEELAFGSYVLSSARNACYDQIERSKRTRPVDEMPEAPAPVGGGFDPGDPEEDPERRMLLEARTEEIRLANLSLPERQREVLALRELEELSYDEIAGLMDMNRNSVAQLISRARINLRDALRGSALASIAASSPDCEGALRLVALEQDGELDETSHDAGWLTEHLMHCHTCRLGRDAMQEAGVSYRAWAPVAAGPLLFRETMARAAEHLRANRNEAVARHQPRRGITTEFGRAAALGHRLAGGARAAILSHRRRDLTLIGVLTCLLLLVVLVGATSEDDPLPVTVPAAEEGEAVAAEEVRKSPTGAKEKKARKKKRRRPEEPAAPVYEPVAPAAVPVAVEPEPAEPKRPKRRPRTRVNVERRPENPPERRSQPEPVPEITPEPPPPPPTETAPAPAPPPEPPAQPPPPPPQQPPPPPPCTGPNCGQPPGP